MADQAEQDDRSQGGAGAGGGGAPRSSAAARLAAKRAAKAAAKASKKGTAPIVPSGLAGGVSKAGGFYAEHKGVLWTGAAVLALAAIGWFAITGHVSKTAAEAAELLGAGVKTAQAPVIEEGETVPEGVQDSYPSERDRAQKALDDYRAVLQKFPDSTAARWAKLGEANTLLELEKHAEAEKAFREALERARSTKDGYVTWRALEGLGFALEALDKHAEAASRFEELASLQNGALRAPGVYHRARMLVALGKKEEAATLLEEMIKSERERPPEEGGPRFENVLADAELLLNGLATELGKPKLEPQVPSQPGLGGGPAGQGLSPELMEALRKQLEASGAQAEDEPAPSEGTEGATP